MNSSGMFTSAPPVWLAILTAALVPGCIMKGIRCPACAWSSGKHCRSRSGQITTLNRFSTVHVARDLTPEKIKAYRIADNQLATLASWDDELLAKEIKELLAADYDTTLLGFDDNEMEALLGPTATSGTGLSVWA